MKFLKKAVEEAKKVPKAVWIASVIVPGGFTALGIYFAIKSIKIKQPEKSSRDLVNEWKKND